MKKIFAFLTLAAFTLGGATAFANTRSQATNSMAKTTSAKKKGKRKHRRHHSTASAATHRNASTPKKK